VCDRYFHQFFFDLLGRFGLRVLAIFPKPDIIFFLDAELAPLYARMINSFDASTDKEYYEQVLAFYGDAANRHNFVVLNALSSKEDINEQILREVQVRINGR